MSPSTYSTSTPRAAASARARSRKTEDESSPVTLAPRQLVRDVAVPAAEVEHSHPRFEFEQSPDQLRVLLTTARRGEEVQVVGVVHGLGVEKVRHARRIDRVPLPYQRIIWARM
jgi:hypothetical protein